MRTRDGLALASAVAAIALLGAPAAAQEPTVEVLAEGLNAPRGLVVAPTAASGSPRRAPPARPAWRPRAARPATAPAVPWRTIVDGSVERVVEGLTSAGAGPEVGGVSDVAVAEDGSLYLLMNLGDDPAVRAGMPPEFATAGWLVKAAADGTTRAVRRHRGVRDRQRP